MSLNQSCFVSIFSKMIILRFKPRFLYDIHYINVVFRCGKYKTKENFLLELYQIKEFLFIKNAYVDQRKKKILATKHGCLVTKYECKRTFPFNANFLKLSNGNSPTCLVTI